MTMINYKGIVEAAPNLLTESKLVYYVIPPILDYWGCIIGYHKNYNDFVELVTEKEAYKTKEEALEGCKDAYKNLIGAIKAVRHWQTTVIESGGAQKV